jgi:hypothetical protein
MKSLVRFYRNTWWTPIPLSEDLLARRDEKFGLLGTYGEDILNPYRHEDRDKVLLYPSRSHLITPNFYEFERWLDSGLYSDEFVARFMASRLAAHIRAADNDGGSFTNPASEFLALFDCYGDDLFDYDMPGHVARLEFNIAKDLWALGRDVLTPFHIGVALRHGTWETAGSNSSLAALRLPIALSAVTIGEFAFAVARFPRILGLTLDDLIHQNFLDSQIQDFRNVAGEAALAWLCVWSLYRQGMSDNRNTDPGRINDFFHLVKRYNEEGYSFDEVIRYVSIGFWDIRAIEKAMASQADMSVLGDMLRGNG